MLEVIWLGLKVLLVVPVLFVIKLIYSYIQVQRRITFYEKQGVTVMPGARSFVGNVKDLMAYTKHVKSIEGNEKGHMIYFGNKFAKDQGKKYFDGKEDPIFLMNNMNDVTLCVSDHNVVQEMFTTKMNKIDKDGVFQQIFEPLLGDGFILVPAKEPFYKPRRKHVSQAFFREKLEALGAHLRGFLTTSTTQWFEQMDKADGVTQIDLSTDFEEILMRNTTKNVFGQDISDTKIDFEFQTPDGIQKGELGMTRAIFANFSGIMNQAGLRMLNPFQTQFTAASKSVNRNCTNLREFLRENLHKRIEDRKNDPTVGEKFDFLNLMLDAQDGLFDEYGILSQISDIYLASTQTSTVAIQQAFSYFVKNKEGLQRAREEVDLYIKEEMKKDPSLRDLSRLEVLNKLINGETCYAFEFINQVVMEALRYTPPLGSSSAFKVLEDMQFGRFNIKQGDKLQLWIYQVHRNSDQWQRPQEFLPQRFDPDDPLFLTPDGKKRNPYSFVPFNGGIRMCLGKTQAELNIRTFIIFLTQLMDFEFAETEKYVAKDDYPSFSIYLSKKIPIPINLRKRKFD